MCDIYNISSNAAFHDHFFEKETVPEQALKMHSSTVAADFVRGLLAIDPAERPTGKDARSSKWLLGSDDPLDQNSPGGSSQNQTLLLKTPAERSTPGDAHPLSLDDSLEKTITGGLSQSQSLLPTRESGPAQLPPLEDSSPTMRRPVFRASLKELYK